MPRFRHKTKSNTKFIKQTNKQQKKTIPIVLLRCAFSFLVFIMPSPFFARPGGLDLRWEECNDRIFNLSSSFMLALKIYKIQRRKLCSAKRKRYQFSFNHP